MGAWPSGCDPYWSDQLGDCADSGGNFIVPMPSGGATADLALPGTANWPKTPTFGGGVELQTLTYSPPGKGSLCAIAGFPFVGQKTGSACQATGLGWALSVGLAALPVLLLLRRRSRY